MTSARPSVRIVAATLLAAALGVAGASCSSGGSDKASDTKVTPSGAYVDTSTSAPPSTTTTAAPTTVPVAPVGLPSQEAAAQRLYDAWFADDRTTAATVADPAAIEAMWKTARGDYSLYNHCSTGEFDTSGCLYRGNLGTIQFDLEKRGANWVVAGAFYSDPTSGG